jgi:triosephosphate isomerase
MPAPRSRPRPLIAGNWKMNGLRRSLVELASIRDAVVSSGHDGPVEVAVCVPATLLALASELVRGRLALGAQDCHAAPSGPHTGDISAEMLADLGTHYVIVGHSERRIDHGETSAEVNAKARAAWRAGLVPIVCLGETEAARDSGQTLEVVRRQLIDSVPIGVRGDNIVIAYEPVWAIGTGRTPTSGEIAEVHGLLRDELTAQCGPAAAEVRLLYGGSVNPANAADLMRIDEVDGALVGGASLKAKDFLAIVDVYG